MHTFIRQLLRATVIMAGALAIAACQSTPVKSVTGLFHGANGDQAYAAGVKAYEAGNYADSIKNLQAALDQGLSAADQTSAHKYLAFTYCVTARERLCREEFRKALDIDPNFELLPAEAGHPLWGPVFRSVKSRKAGERSR